jgi:tetratricopeptide (TPR) repeat protein
MVATLSSPDKDLGQQAAEAIRSRISRDVNNQKLTVIPKGDIENTLKASGYSTTESLQLNDAKALAVLLRADEFIDGNVSKTPTGVKIESRLILSRDQTLQQPLPVAEAPKLDAAAALVSKSYQAAREQLANEKSCYMLFREGKFAEAETMARAALAKYPNGTIAAVCLGNAFESQKKEDSLIAVAERIRAIDPRNISALRWAADYYGSHNNADKASEALIGLMAADPNNERLRDQVIASLVQAHKLNLAIPIVDEALKANPGDPKTLGMAWKVFLAGPEYYPRALDIGAQMIAADTALADTAYFLRTFAAASTISPAKAGEIAAQGIAKFPQNVTLLLYQANALSKAGQNAQALPIINRVLAQNPKTEGALAQKALILSNLNMPDSVMAVVNQCAVSGSPDDRKQCAQVALKAGSDAYKAGNASKARPDLQRAVAFLLLSDKLDGSADAKFLAGASAFLVGQSAVNEAQTTKNCQLARLAKESFATAQENVPAGLTSYADAAKQLLTAIPQFTPAVEDQVKRFCK